MTKKQRIEALEKRVQALEGNIATSGYCQPAQGVNNPSYTIESSRNPIVEGGEITSIKTTSTIKPTYPIESEERIAELEALKDNYTIESIANMEFAKGFEAGRKERSKNIINVPFELDEDEEFLFPVKDMGLFTHLSSYCKRKNIDPKQIKRIILEMKSEVEE